MSSVLIERWRFDAVNIDLESLPTGKVFVAVVNHLSGFKFFAFMLGQRSA